MEWPWEALKFENLFEQPCAVSVCNPLVRYRFNSAWITPSLDFPFQLALGIRLGL